MKRFRAGFALPTVLIASLVMMMVLMTALTATSGTKNNLDDQYYTKLAHSAAEAGVTYAQECMSNDGNRVTWSGQTLSSGENCAGDALTHGGERYLTTNSTLHTRWEIPTVSAGSGQPITVIGYTELKRKSDGSVWKRYSKTLKFNMSEQMINSSIETISSGTNNVCFVAEDGDVYCVNGSSVTPAKKTLPAAAKSVGVSPDGMISSGQTSGLGSVPPNFLHHKSHYACANLVTNEVYCWGSGVQGWSVSVNDMMPFHNINPTRVTLPAGVTVIDMAFSPSRACFITSTGEVYCIGKGTSLVASQVSLPAAASKVVMNPAVIAQSFKGTTSSNHSGYYGGHWHACALLVDGRVSCWNSGKVIYNREYEMPFGTSPGLLSFPGGATVKQMSSGTSHACFTLTDGDVYCLGSFSGRTLTKVTLPAAAASVEVSPDGMYAAQSGDHILHRGYYVCANLVTNEVYCWGTGVQNLTPTASNSMPFHASTPTKVGLPSGVKVKDMALGSSRVCFLTELSDVYCLGTGTTLTPTSMSLPGSAEKIVLSPTNIYQSSNSYRGTAWHVCVLLESGQVSCWDSGVIVGNLDMPFTTTPTLLAFPPGVTIGLPDSSSGGTGGMVTPVY